MVELCLALHTTFDFSRDRLIWDTGHQIYPHKLITGRYHEFGTIRTKGGLMGYPNPHESDYDLFMTGHAGCSVSTALGLKSGDDLMPGQADRHSGGRDRRRCVSLGHRLRGDEQRRRPEARNCWSMLNDNKCRSARASAGWREYLDRLRVNPFYTGLKSEVLKVLNKVPLLGDPAERFLAQIKEAVKAGLHGGMLFEELGFRYIGPIDGHKFAQLRKYLKMVKDVDGPGAAARRDRKGTRLSARRGDPVYFHTPAPFTCEAEGMLAIQARVRRAPTPTSPARRLSNRWQRIRESP